MREHPWQLLAKSCLEVGYLAGLLMDRAVKIQRKSGEKERQRREKNEQRE